MNDYKGFDQCIVKCVRTHARILKCKNRFLDIEDLEQELMCAAIKAMRSFDPDRGLLKHFLHKILYNAARNILKQKSVQSFSIKADGIIIPIFDEVNHELQKMIPHLPFRYKCILWLLKHHTIAQIAAILQLSIGTIKRDIGFIRSVFRILDRSLEEARIFIEKEFVMKNLSVIETSSIKELSELAMYDLADLNDQVAKLLSHAKDLKTKLDDALALRFSETVNANLRQENRDTGTTKFIENGFQITAEVPQKVTWDAEQMEKIIKKIPEDKCKSIVKTTYVIDERRYSQLSYEYKLLFQPARTVTPGKIRFQITLPEDQHGVGSGNF